MGKADFLVLRDAGRLVLSVTLAHGLTTRMWREWHSFGLVLWVVGEVGYALA